MCKAIKLEKLLGIIEIHPNHNVKILSFKALNDKEGDAIIKCINCNSIYYIRVLTTDPDKIQYELNKSIRTLFIEELKN